MYDKINRINTLIKTAGNIVIPLELQASKRELTKDEQDRKSKIRKGKLWKKSYSVMPGAGILKKQGTITDHKKKVQFSTKKTVFKYTPQR